MAAASGDASGLGGAAAAGVSIGAVLAAVFAVLLLLAVVRRRRAARLALGEGRAVPLFFDPGRHNKRFDHFGRLREGGDETAARELLSLRPEADVMLLGEPAWAQSAPPAAAVSPLGLAADKRSASVSSDRTGDVEAPRPPAPRFVDDADFL